MNMAHQTRISKESGGSGVGASNSGNARSVAAPHQHLGAGSATVLQHIIGDERYHLMVD